MTELLSENQFFIFVQKVELLIGNHFFDSSIDVCSGGYRPFYIIWEIFTNLLSIFLNEFRFYTCQDSQKRALCPFERKLTSHFHGVFFDILMEHLAIKLGWGFFGHLIWELTTLSLNDICFSWCDAIGLGVLTFTDASLDSLFVGPCWIFMFNQPFSWRLVFSFWSGHVVTIQNIVDSWHWSVGDAHTSVSTRNHLIHNLFEFSLNFFRLPPEIGVSNLSLTAFVFKYSLNVRDRTSISSWWG